MALSRLISTPYVSEASLKYSSRFSGEETLPEEVVLFVAEELEIAGGIRDRRRINRCIGLRGKSKDLLYRIRETAPLLLAASSASTAMACTRGTAEARHSLNVVTLHPYFSVSVYWQKLLPAAWLSVSDQYKVKLLHP